jgi:hypothetical protein
MLKRIQGFLLFLFVAACVEPYHFVIENDEPTLVVEAYLSDKSFNETVSYSDGRYFTVKLTTTTDVINVRPVPIKSAHVQLLNDKGEIWEYSESVDKPGAYVLIDDNFEAKAGVNYKLSIKLPDESKYESDWETMPTTVVPAMGNISFREDEIEKYVIKVREEVLETFKGIWAEINVPENTTKEPVYYRWTYTAHWEFVAALASPSRPGHRCWVTNPLAIQHYAIQHDRTGAYNKDLYFLETIRNDQIFIRYSSLIVQHAMTEEFYTFWKEMKEQNEGGAILDKPPLICKQIFIP